MQESGQFATQEIQILKNTDSHTQEIVKTKESHWPFAWTDANH